MEGIGPTLRKHPSSDNLLRDFKIELNLIKEDERIRKMADDFTVNSNDPKFNHNNDNDNDNNDNDNDVITNSSLNLHLERQKAAFNESIGGGWDNLANQLSNRPRSHTSSTLLNSTNLDSHPNFSIVVVGASMVGKTTVIRKGFRKWGLSSATLLSPPERGKIQSRSSLIEIHGQPKHVEIIELGFAALNFNDSQNLFPHFIQNIDAIVICYDATDERSFVGVIDILKCSSMNSLPRVLLACKSGEATYPLSVSSTHVNPNSVVNLGKQLDVGLIEVTALTGDGRRRMRGAFDWIFRNIRKQRKEVRDRGLSNSSEYVSPQQYLNQSQPSQQFIVVDRNSIDEPSPIQLKGSQLIPPTINTNNPLRMSVSSSEGDAIMSEATRGLVDITSPTYSTFGDQDKVLLNTLDERNDNPENDDDDTPKKRERKVSNPLLKNFGYDNSKDTALSRWVTLDDLLNKLIFAAVSGNDQEFVKSFFSTYRKFTRAYLVLEAMLKRYDEISKDCDSVLVTFTQSRLLTLLDRWIRHYPGDLLSPIHRYLIQEFFSRATSNISVIHYAPCLKQHLDKPAINYDPEYKWSIGPDSYEIEFEIKINESDIKFEDSELPLALSFKRKSNDANVVVPSMISSDVNNGSTSPTTASSTANNHSRRESSSAFKSWVNNRQRSDSEASKFTSSSNTVATSANSSTSSNPINSPQIRRKSIDKVAQCILENSPSCSAIDMAHELTRIEWTLFLKINDRDLIRHALISSKDRDEDSIDFQIRHFNYLTQWVVNLVLSQTKPKLRLKIVEYLVNVAEELRNLNNYHTMHAVLSAFDVHSVFRLMGSKVIDLESNEELYTKFRKLKLIFTSDRSSATYREVLRNTPCPSIPYLGVHMQDILASDTANVNNKKGENDEELIHWSKFALMAEACKQIMKRQKYQHDFQFNEKVNDLIFDITLLDEDDLFLRSKHLEQIHKSSYGNSGQTMISASAITFKESLRNASSNWSNVNNDGHNNGNDKRFFKLVKTAISNAS